MIVHDVAQGTSKWMALRAGIPTASCFDKIITPGGKKSESAAKYMAHLLAERILGRPIDGFKSAAMENGTENEDSAIAAYEMENDCETYRIGFVTTDDGRIGCSPDRGIVGDPRTLVEAKSPDSPAVMVSYLLSSVGASKEYKCQLQGQLWVCEKDQVDIVAYSAGFPKVIFRATRDEVFIKEMAAHVRAFSCQLEEKAADFAERGWIKPPSDTPDEEYDGLGVSEADLRQMYPNFFPGETNVN